jgi:hypothetical protein
MAETLTLILSLITALGLGGIAGAVVQYLVERRKQVQSQHFDFKQRRYGSIIITMIARIGPREDLPKLTAVRPDLRTMEDVARELDVELLNAFLFAGDPVIERLAEFIQSPSRRTLLGVADAMRRDLYGHSNNLTAGTIKGICGLGPIGTRDVVQVPAVIQRQNVEPPTTADPARPFVSGSV